MEGISYAETHHVLDLIHPILDRLLVRVDKPEELHTFLLGRKHGMNLLILIELDAIDILEHLLQVGLHCCGFLGL